MATMGFIQSASVNTKISSIIVPETFTHSIAFGQTGCGKTTSFIYPNLQERIKNGHGILVYDYKGKEHSSVKFLAQEAGRLIDVIEVGKPWGESINLLENMNEEELDLFFDNVLSHNDDNKYWHNSAKSMGQSVLKVLKAIEGFANSMQMVDKNFYTTTKVLNAGYPYPLKRTFASLVKVCNTFESISKFVENLDALLLYSQQLIVKSLKKKASENPDIKRARASYTKLVKSKERLGECINGTRDSLESFGKDSNENLTQNILGSLIAPLLSLSQNPFFNTNSFDIVKALNEGKIVVINTQALSNAALESLNNVVLNELSQRTRSLSINPVSVFIDEAQRVLSKSTDLPVDVLREAKVDIFLATQNSALLKSRLGEEKFDALMGNLTAKFYFKNSKEEESPSACLLNSFATFEYITHEDNYENSQSSEPVYISMSQKLAVEKIYQKRLNVLSDFAYTNRRKSIVLEYVPRLYKEKKLLAIHTQTLKETTIESQNRESVKRLERKIDLLFDTVLAELYEDQDHDLEDDYELDNDFEIDIAS
ncbi:MAG: hypothetical protein FP820_02525 [Sulfurimonas sp.]|nr:hypothetical protein [Sulfurimonas sp.]MBU3938050.1 TraM recognition domain-containing protein [bacterium]MBU4024139.1 TraM recognition domain-containing protein [bacterium]